MFEAKMAGGVNDPDELVVNAFKAFDEEVEEKIKGQLVTRHILYKDDFTHILTAFGDKLTEDEIDDIFVPGAMDEKKEEDEEEQKEGAPTEGAAPAAEEGGRKMKKNRRRVLLQKEQLLLQ